MKRKKNVLSYFVWGLYSIFTAVGVYGCVNVFGEDYCLSTPVRLAVWVGVFMVAAVVTFGCNRLIYTVLKKTNCKKYGTLISCLEGVMVIAFLAAGLYFRIHNITLAEVNSVYLDVARMKADGGVPELVHGATYLYLHLLHVIFYFLGNKAMAIIWMQIGLHIGVCIFLYCGIKNLVGRVAGIVSLAMLTLSPTMVFMPLYYSPLIVYLFLFSFVFCLASSGMERREKKVSLLFMGGLESVLLYLDLSGALLILLSIYIILCNKKEDAGLKKKLADMLAHIIGCVAGFIGSFAVDSCLSGKELFQILNSWCKLFAPKGFVLPLEMSLFGSIEEYSILFFFMSIGIFSFWLCKQDKTGHWITGLFATGVAVCSGMFTSEMSGEIWLYIILIVMAVGGIENCFCINDDDKTDLSPEVHSLPEVQADTELHTSGEEQSEAQDREQTEFEPLENPLPLPRRHVKKTMDFKMDDLEDDFDVEINENDDFDL